MSATAVPRRRVRRPWLATALAALFVVVWLFPLYWMLNTAFKPRDEVLTPVPRFLPSRLNVDNFVIALTQTDFLVNLRNSVIVVFSAVIFAIVIGFLASAALTRFRFRGRRSIMISLLAAQMLPGAALLIPLFLIFNEAGLTGTYAGLILVYIGHVLPFAIWTMRGFFLAIPVEIEEAAQIDGASTWRILRSVLLPLVLPGVISTSVFAFITAWNDYILAYTFMKDSSMYTLTIWLASFSTVTKGTDFGAQMAASVLFSLPVVVFFLLVQRRLVSGMAAGAVKG
ncbi:carbohydrate ABC transporter permease [Microbacterium sp. USTB-Y]|uniref:carbohydrate ABC transporter permease n=1 Tax=Microbacterium sp. USTB-Y TaxID=2823692 RepID=UPI00203B10FC|nr:carbohydrate ABC transporter permease [Microbacterium sp. USTB-Y]